MLTLCAVFVPIAFLGGLTGELYRQFAVTISIAVVISGLVALTLTPALCVLILKREHQQPGPLLRVVQPLVRARHQPLHRRRRVDDPARRASALVLFVGMVAITAGLWRITPGSLVPDEDQGFYIAAVILPDGATLAAHRQGRQRSRRGDPARNPANEDVDRLHRLRLPRRRLPQQRRDDLRHAEALGRAQGRPPQQLVGELFSKTGHIKEALVLAFNPPPIFGLGTAGGFEFYIQNRGEGGAQAAGRSRCSSSSARANQDPMLGGVQTLWRAERAAALRRRRPREGEGARRADRRGLQHAVGHARHLLRQRLQQVRPHLAGADVGRAGVPQAARRHRRGLRALGHAARWCRCRRSRNVQLHVRARTRSTASTTCRR